MLTTFQKKVYSIVKQIPRGKTKTYGEIAGKLKTSPRAVGRALKKNFDKNVPCHRVVGKSCIGGYNRGVELKKKLLESEK